jgi:hypothetical protein
MTRRKPVRPAEIRLTRREAEAIARDRERCLKRMVVAAQPYVELAAPHEQLFSGEDLRRFEALSAALDEARTFLRQDQQQGPKT